MPRLPDEVIEKLKTEISLLRLIESQGYRPVRQGKDYAIGCPFHEHDDTPSLIIRPHKIGGHTRLVVTHKIGGLPLFFSRVTSHISNS